MTQDEIIEMAKQAGFLTYTDRSYILSPSHDVDYDLIGELKAFAKLIDAKATACEREACAKVCDEFGEEWNCRSTTNEIAAEIRARGEA